MTKHTCGGPSFGRLTEGCPRCDELKSGAAPRRQAWRKTAVVDAARHCWEIEHHDCERTGCGPVCTFGGW